LSKRYRIEERQNPYKTLREEIMHIINSSFGKNAILLDKGRIIKKGIVGENKSFYNVERNQEKIKNKH
jgi:hypothetical protein